MGVAFTYVHFIDTCMMKLAAGIAVVSGGTFVYLKIPEAVLSVVIR